jgi:hypothetical protein
MSVVIETGVAFLGFERNVRVTNGDVELVLPTEYGPRIMRYARPGASNILGELSPALHGKVTPFGEPWHIYGGHRLWYAPEDATRSYYPDNRPVHVGITAPTVTLTQDIEAHTLLEKAIAVTLADRGTAVTVDHRITNRGASAIELAPWALTVMTQGGRGIFRHADFAPHPQALAPARSLVLWPYTRMNDPRWTWGDRLFVLHQDPSRREAQKVGFYDDRGWMAYERGGNIFVKQHEPRTGPHADSGCNTQTFANDAFLELESLGPLRALVPGAAVTHREVWSLHDGLEMGNDEASMRSVLASIGYT